MNNFNDIYNLIINKNKNMKDLFEYIYNKAKSSSLDLYIEYVFEDNGTYGLTKYNPKDDKNHIFINLYKENMLKSLNNGQSYEGLERAVIIHELGEVDYIISKLPTINKDEYCDLPDIINNELRVLISHKHVNELIKKYHLCNIVYNQLAYKGDVNQIINNLKKWQIIIKICWILLTYPQFNTEIKNLNIKLEDNIVKDINTILEIINNMDTLDNSDSNIKKIENDFNEIINILNKNGMKIDVKDEIKVISRRISKE